MRAFRIIAANELNLPAPVIEHIETFALAPLAESVPCTREQFPEFMRRLTDNHDHACWDSFLDRASVGRGKYRGEEIWHGGYSGKYAWASWKIFPRKSMRDVLLPRLLNDDEESEDDYLSEEEEEEEEEE
eukprot:COSAG04_NODE_11695_length_693_cov_1.663300_1_plen_129_part_10